MHYIELGNNKVVSKGKSDISFVLPEGYAVIDKELYERIGAIPCAYVEVDGVITEIEYIEPDPKLEPTPEPTESELLSEYIVDVDFRVAMLELGL